jgi:NAD(P)-dependent dehydrogenase (short-subunit alcohol dehydrogenase family)
MPRPALLAFALLLLAGPLGACATTPPLERGGQPALAGRTVVITGASSGFGRGIAVAMARRGANVVLAARRAPLLEAVAAEARAAGGQALVVPTDVSRPEAVAALAQAAEARFGRVDVWINNAGIGALGRFDETPVADHNRIVEVNLKGRHHGSHEAIGPFPPPGPRDADQHGLGGEPGAYAVLRELCGDQARRAGLSEALNQELRANGEGRRIRVVT